MKRGEDAFEKGKRASERRQRGVRASGRQMVRSFGEFSSYELGLTSSFVVLRAGE